MSHGMNAVVVTICVLAILALLYGLADRNRVRIDFSMDSAAGLQGDTLHKLELVERDEAPLHITAFSAQQGKRDTYFKNRALRDLLAEVDYATSDVKCQYVDFDRDRLTAESMGVNAYGTLVLQHGEDRIDIKDRALFRRRGKGDTQRLEFLGEAAIAQALGQLLSEQIRPLYVLTGHGELSVESPSIDSLGQLASLLEREGYTLKTLDLLRDRTEDAAPRIPNDAAALLIARPKVPLTDSENDAIETFVAGGGGLVVLLDVGSTVPQAVTRMGIEVPEGFVMDTLRVFPFDDRPVGVYARHPITADLSEDGLVTVVAHVAPLRKPEGVENDVLLQSLLRTSRKGWIERGGALESGAAVFEPAFDLAGTIDMAFAAQRSGANGQPVGARAVVVGDAEAFTNALLLEGPGNATFAVNAFRWVVGDDDRLTIVGRPTRVRNVTLTERDARLLRWVSLGLGPTLILLLGAAVWVGRRGR
jgi:hypothetical protein